MSYQWWEKIDTFNGLFERFVRAFEKEKAVGVHKNIGFKPEEFPAQGKFFGKKVQVCFNYDSANKVEGMVLRDDAEDPFRTLILLKDGRCVDATECQYSIDTTIEAVEQ